jgi:probable rRNA maturation factor
MADRMLAELELVTCELSVLLTNDARIQQLNREHRGKDRPTDVLAFPLDDAPQAGLPVLLGDVVISLDTAERQARARRRELVAEVRFLLAHGVLHLVGYDHANPAEHREMSRMTRKLVLCAPLPAESAGERKRKKTARDQAFGRKKASPRRKMPALRPRPG